LAGATLLARFDSYHQTGKIFRYDLNIEGVF
jgi:hypothetical protein